MRVDNSFPSLNENIPLPALLPASRKRPSKSVTSNLQPGEKNGKKSGNINERRVLMFGRLRELALYRAEVLRRAGFTVLLPQTKEETEEILKRCALDVAVFSYTLPSATVEELSDVLRDYCPDIPLISISDKPWSDRRIAPTEVVIADEGPAALIAALRRVTKM